jgi:hypothetical protein
MSMGLRYHIGVVKRVWPASVQYDRSSTFINNVTTYNRKKHDTIDLEKFKVCFEPNRSFRTKSEL